jgi:hypothetical protein
MSRKNNISPGHPPEFRKQTLEPVNGAGRFDAHAHRFRGTLQAPVERLSLTTFVVQSALDNNSLVSALAMAIC